MRHLPMRFGIDFGGVIVQPGATLFDEDTAHDDGGRLLQPGAVEAVTRIVALSEGNTWIVSKAHPRMQARTRNWLDYTGFWGATGLSRDHLRFCLERAEKRAHCEELRITHFIDDKIAVMQHLQTTVRHPYRFAPAADAPFTPRFATHDTSWDELLVALD